MRSAFSYMTLVVLVFVNSLGADQVILRDLPVLGKTAPQLTSHSGKPMVLVFWAVWCGPCAAELRELERVSRSEKTPFIGIAVDSAEKQAARMVERTGVSFANYLDNDSAFADSVGVSGVPSLLVIDGQGNVVWSQSGYSVFPESELREQIKKITNHDKE